jgi:hypothetical protein
VKLNLLSQTCRQSLQVIMTGDLCRAHPGQMWCCLLDVEQCEPTIPQARNQMGKCYLGRVALPREHGLPEKDPALHDPIKTSHKLIVLPDFDTVRESTSMETQVGAGQFVRNPSQFIVSTRLGAARQDTREIAVAGNTKLITANTPGKTP